MFDIRKSFLCIAYREVGFVPLRKFLGPAEDIGLLVGWFTHRRNPSHTGNAARGQYLENLDGLLAHWPQVARGMDECIYSSSCFRRIGIVRNVGGVSGPGVFGTIDGVGGTWWHCRAAVICVKVLLLGCGAETMDRSVLKQTNLGIPSTPA